MILNVFWQSLTQFKRIFFLFLFLVLGSANAQELISYSTFLPQKISIKQELEKEKFPDPNSVLRKSLLIPGWGQITNKQIWKVPIVYGLIGGLAYYSVTLTKDYHDYRAAYYNSFEENTDLKFGATPANLAGLNQAALLSNRNFLRNRRDFIYVTVVLAYILNAVDAYVFAHLRSFDVSDDLTFSPGLKPTTIYNASIGEVPGVSFSFSFHKKTR